MKSLFKSSSRANAFIKEKNNSLTILVQPFHYLRIKLAKVVFPFMQFEGLHDLSMDGILWQ
jgi:hypothetical protein